MTVTPSQKHVIDCVLAIFETGKVPTPGSYATCAILNDGAGISFGKHQSTDRANSLDLVVKRYIQKGGVNAKQLEPFLPYFAANKSATEPPHGPWSMETLTVVNILRAAGVDPLMQSAQDEVFDENYFTPALNIATQVGAKYALTVLMIYDTCIHSGPGGVAHIRNLFAAKSPANGGDEKEWVRAYIAARRNWLATHKLQVLHATVYRMDALKAIVDAGNWDLVTPLKVRGVSIV